MNYLTVLRFYKFIFIVMEICGKNTLSASLAFPQDECFLANPIETSLSAAPEENGYSQDSHEEAAIRVPPPAKRLHKSSRRRHRKKKIKHKRKKHRPTENEVNDIFDFRIGGEKMAKRVQVAWNDRLIGTDEEEEDAIVSKPLSDCTCPPGGPLLGAEPTPIHVTTTEHVEASEEEVLETETPVPTTHETTHHTTEHHTTTHHTTTTEEPTTTTTTEPTTEETTTEEPTTEETTTEEPTTEETTTETTTTTTTTTTEATTTPAVHESSTYRLICPFCKKPIGISAFEISARRIRYAGPHYGYEHRHTQPVEPYDQYRSKIPPFLNGRRVHHFRSTRPVEPVRLPVRHLPPNYFLTRDFSTGV